MIATKIDRPLFIITASLILIACIPLGLFPEQTGPFVSSLYQWISTNMGIMYQWFAIGTILFLVWLVLGPYGNIRLGDGQPDFSTFSWIGMLFCTGTGAALIVMAGVEWVTHYDAPPYGIEARSTQAIEWATAYGPFHWGITAWCFYALPTIAIAYPYYVKNVPYLRASTSLHALLGPKSANSAIARAVNLASMIALIGGAAGSLGVVAPTIAASVATLLEMENSRGLEIAVIVLCTVIYAGSVYVGLEKGIKRLSDLNVYLALGLLLYILMVGPTLFILKISTDTVGFMLTNFVRMMTWTDPIENTGFVEAWTIFYWAWWIAFGIPVSVFVTRISRGRTIRQVVVSMILAGTLGCWAFYFVLGNYSLFVELHGEMSVTATMAEHGMFVTIANVLTTLPGGSFVLALYVLVSIIATATLFDSSAYIMASSASTELKEGTNPARWHCLFWAAMLGVLPVTFMVMGGLEIIRTGVLVASLPLFFVGVAMAISLIKSLREDAH